ncbi:MAG: transposase [Deltaproteobacteria bacterium]|nr:transposase [Deltaproteobacteria bacterium]
MSRPLRIEYPGAWYHIMNRGRRRENIYTTSTDYHLFVDVMKETAEMFNLKVSAYCLMSNHYHLLVHTPDGNLSRCMRHINGVYTQRFNRTHKKDGQLFRGRFKAVLVDSDSYLLEVLRYIHNNPVQAGIVKNADDFIWSSHKGYCSKAKKWDWLHKNFLLAMFSKKINLAPKAYLEFMQMPEPEEIESFYAKKNLASILGNDDFKEWVIDRFKNLRFKQDVPASKELAVSRIMIKDLVCKSFKVEKTALLTSKRGTENIPRDVAIYLQRKYCGQTLAELGIDYDMVSYSSVSSAFERAKSRLLADRRVKEKVLRIEKQLGKGQRET